MRRNLVFASIAAFIILISGIVYAFYNHDIRSYVMKSIINVRNLPIVDLNRFKTLQIQDLTVNHKQKWFDRSFLNGLPIKTENDLFNTIMYQYSLYKDEIRMAWQINDSELLLTLYFMNITAHLWGYGNSQKITLIGCVFKNEEHPGGIFNPEEPLANHIPAMVNSRIGCCTDHANILNMLLTKANIKNRFIVIPGHVFNEVFVQGKWQAFDSTTNMWWHNSWEQIQNAPLTASIYVTFFPHMGTVYGHDYYRPFIGIFRNYMLLEAVYKLSKDIQHPDRI